MIYFFLLEMIMVNLRICAALLLLILRHVFAANETPATRNYFYAGGNYVETLAGHIFSGQIYVEKLSPAYIEHPYPIVFIHGGFQTGTVSYLFPLYKPSLTHGIKIYTSLITK